MEAMSDQPGFWDTLRQDALAISPSFSRASGRWSFIRRILDRHMFPVFIYRLSAWSWQQNRLGRNLARVLWRLNMSFHFCDIDPRARIGGGLYLPHPQLIVIGKIRMGTGATVFQNVTIGTSPSMDDYDGPEKWPTVGNNVRFYTGAVVTGGIKIGNGARIGANAVVLKDVPDNCLAVGVPARILPPRSQEPAISGKTD